MQSDPYRTTPASARDEAEVPATVPMVLLVVILGVLLTLFAPRHRSEGPECSAMPYTSGHGHMAARR